MHIRPKISFIVHGKQGTAGSKKAFAFVGKDGRPRATLAPATEKQKPFMAAVASKAAEAAEGRYWRHEALHLDVVIVRARPRSHFGSGRNADTVKSSAPSRPTSKPDSLKICRAIEDAMSGVVYHDDSQICSHQISKMYGESDKTIITLSEIEQ